MQAFPALNPFLRHYRGLRKILAATAPVAGHVCYSAPVNECGTKFTFFAQIAVGQVVLSQRHHGEFMFGEPSRRCFFSGFPVASI